MVEKNINILLCDDHELIITGLQHLIISQPGVLSVKSAKNGKQALSILEEYPIDLLVSDVSMPLMDGIQLSAAVKQRFPDVKILILTQFTDMQVIKPLLKNQVDAILLKGGANDEILKAIDVVMSGEKFYSTTIMNIIADCFAGIAPENTTIVKLSKREKQVLGLIAEEKTNREISDALFISIPTVETYRRNLFKKFDVKNSAGLIRKAMRTGFIS